MALNHNGVSLRCTTIFLDCVEQTIKFFKESGDREARTPCLWLRAFWRHRHRTALRQLAHKLNGEISARAWESVWDGRPCLPCVLKHFVVTPKHRNLHPFGQLGSESLMRPSVHSNISNCFQPRSDLYMTTDAIFCSAFVSDTLFGLVLKLSKNFECG